MTVKQLRLLLDTLPDDALVFARDRDTVNLEKVHVIGSIVSQERPNQTTMKTYGAYVYFVDTPNQMYGGDRLPEEVLKHAIVFCECG